jgi:epoxyqueuosine reductase
MALGRDYHRSVRELLGDLAGRISARRYKILVDGGGLVEREWAVKAGLGFWGKNCCVISPSKGSFFNIGLLLTDLELPSSKECSGVDCGACTRCLDACPGKALVPFKLNHKNCVSYITQKNGELSYEDRAIMGRQVFFCDICQRVCPYNKEIAPEPAVVSLTRLMNMSEEEFRQTCAHTAMNWKGLKILKRNAVSVFSALYKWG